MTSALQVESPVGLACRSLDASTIAPFPRDFGIKYQLEEKKEIERRITSRRLAPTAKYPQ